MPGIVIAFVFLFLVDACGTAENVQKRVSKGLDLKLPLTLTRVQDTYY